MKQLLILTVLGLAGLPAFAANGSGSFEIPAGAVTDLPELDLHWESFELPAPARAALASGRRGDVVELSAFPVAPGVRRDVRFEAFEVYAPGAKIWEIRDGERREIPRDGSARYLGRSADGGTRVGLSLAGEELYAFALSPEGAYRLTGPKADGTFAVEDATPPGGLLYEGCGTEHMAIPDSVLDAMEALRPSGLPASLQGTEQEVQGAPASRQAVVAVDTDTELLSEKFGNNSTTALTYITSLFVVLNVMYERDLDLFLLQGDTTIRTGSDPFNNTDTPASLAQLQQFWT